MPDAEMRLANCGGSKGSSSHLLVFGLSHGFFAVLTPFIERPKDNDKGD